MSVTQNSVSTAADIKPYEVVDSDKTVDDVLGWVNEAVFTAHGPITRARGGVVGVIADPVFQYERLMRDLVAIDGMQGIPFCELLARKPGPGERLCGIRHDIDIDVRTALTLAELEQQYGIRSTWFVLHTAPYYGEFEGGKFKRHDAMLHVYKRLQDLGHEIALHTDAMHVYQVQQLDGAQAITTEIEWLRENGIKVVGTTAHNSASVYGAENFAIFKGRPQSFSDRAAEARTEVTHNGRWAALGVLDEAQLGLQYEANDLFWQDDVSVAYAATRGVNRWRWNSESSNGYHRKHKTTRTNSFVSYEALIANLTARDSGEYICLVVHPVYYGARHTPSSGPVRKMSRRREGHNNQLGWTTYTPGELQAVCGMVDGRQEFQSLNETDAWGMLALPQPTDGSDGGCRILILGGRNIDGASCSVEGQLHSMLQHELNDPKEPAATVIKLAHREIGLARYYAWYLATFAETKPDVVVLGIGADELTRSIPKYWQRTTGFNAKHPPGSYLALGDDGQVCVIPASPGAQIHRARAEESFNAPSLVHSSTHEDLLEEREMLEKFVRFFIEDLQAQKIKVVLLVEECGETSQLWSAGQTDVSRARQAHRNFMNWLRPIAQALGVAIADPYALFLGSPAFGSTHWQSQNEWNYIGHREAASALAAVLRVASESPSSTGAANDDALSQYP
ncbi:MAG: hypothetical protein ACI9BW_001153 [Gammaproteobacteria bacterium]|jgi:hypothetical protein